MFNRKTYRGFGGTEKRMDRWLVAICVSWFVFFASGSVLIAASQPETTVSEQAIVISLPVFVVSLFTTIGATWTVSRYVSNRDRKADEMQKQINRLTEQVKAQND